MCDAGGDFQSKLSSCSQPVGVVALILRVCLRFQNHTQDIAEAAAAAAAAAAFLVIYAVYVFSGVVVVVVVVDVLVVVVGFLGFRHVCMLFCSQVCTFLFSCSVSELMMMRTLQVGVFRLCFRFSPANENSVDGRR